MKTCIGKRVAVIGAGPAGLAAARHFTAAGSPFECTVFEQGDDLGGTWRLSEHVGTDYRGRQVHSSMYKNLRTNLPKEIMCYPDYPFPEYPESYVKSGKVLKYLEDYASQFDLRRLIKFNRVVLEVLPVKSAEEDKTYPEWKVTTLDIVTSKKETNLFDGIMVCNGHHSDPEIPEVEGIEKFGGHVMHSHDYRESTPFKGQRVLVVGAGPSGLDIALEVSKEAKTVTLSHHMKTPEINFHGNVNQAPDIECFMYEKIIKFVNGSLQEFDSVIFCTGYRNSFPFLHKDCKITTDGYGVEPLYKHMINIEYPTMCLTGLVTFVCPFQLLDLQARFSFSLMSGKCDLPSKEEMYEELRADQEWRRNKGLGPRQAHKLGSLQQQYYDELAQIAHIESIDVVVSKLSLESTKRIFSDLCTFREAKFKIIDKENYIEL
ncbi:senecionine N-oxygenase-like [Neocloeon triangulifer]|uniref:senecionine N-oxygenase-like n=1 Tax=Neocloeon triangulifer TaxID=2078957 RepID=UPI00286F433A|nr:senecionine N-oxygenase-like [Neocloeon triangulifer]